MVDFFSSVERASESNKGNLELDVVGPVDMLEKTTSNLP